MKRRRLVSKRSSFFGNTCCLSNFRVVALGTLTVGWNTASNSRTNIATRGTPINNILVYCSSHAVSAKRLYPESQYPHSPPASRDVMLRTLGCSSCFFFRRARRLPPIVTILCLRVLRSDTSPEPQVKRLKAQDQNLSFDDERNVEPGVSRWERVTSPL